MSLPGLTAPRDLAPAGLGPPSPATRHSALSVNISHPAQAFVPAAPTAESLPTFLMLDPTVRSARSLQVSPVRPLLTSPSESAVPFCSRRPSLLVALPAAVLAYLHFPVITHCLLYLILLGWKPRESSPVLYIVPFCPRTHVSTRRGWMFGEWISE